MVLCILQGLYECVLPTETVLAWAKQNFVELIFSLSAANGHTYMGVYDLCHGIDPCLGLTSFSVVEFYSWYSPEDQELLLCRHNLKCVLSLLHGTGHRIGKTETVYSLLLSVLCAYRKAKWCSHRELRVWHQWIQVQSMVLPLTSSVALGRTYFLWLFLHL